MQNIKRISFLAIMMISAALFSGCSAIIIPNPGEVVKHPLGTESIKIGMSKAQVESIWGKPSQIKMVEDKEKWKGSREVWIYHAQYSSIPVDAGYLSSTKRLYFDGNNLTEIGE
ncbi:MAG: hypothetical protein PHI58_00650 [Candidatus Omnitrophica bacterium]|nr:hypothetical protein [Candidatus Omnitrophota bacterium]